MIYTQVWGSNPTLCNFLQISGNLGERDLLIKTTNKKAYKRSSTWCKLKYIQVSNNFSSLDIQSSFIKERCQRFKSRLSCFP
ncbi:hypothetical protein YC2023_106894 [Brassica napus]